MLGYAAPAEMMVAAMFSGAGARSLAGMPARRDLIRRPFLGVRRRDTLERDEVSKLGGSLREQVSPEIREGHV